MEHSASRLIATRADRRLLDLRLSPRPVAWLYLRIAQLDAASGDSRSLDGTLGPRDLARLLELTRDCRRVIEIGGGSGWTSIALALADPGRRVVSFDPIVPPERDDYLALVPPDVLRRIELRAEPAERARKTLRGQVELVLVDGSGGRKHTLTAFRIAGEMLRPGGLVVVHGYGGRYASVAEAMDELGIAGSAQGRLFTWTKPLDAPSRKRTPRAAPAWLRSASRVAPLALAGVAIGVGAGAALTAGGGDESNGPSARDARVSGPAADASRPGPGEGGRNETPGRRATSTSGDGRKTSGRSRRGSGSGAVAPPAPARSSPGSTGASVQTFTGNGTRKIGTIRVRRPSVLRWRTDGEVFSIASEPLRANFYSSEGSTNLPPGPYRDFEVGTAGDWKIEIEPR